MGKEILVLSGHGIDLRLNSGKLKIKSGFPIEGNNKESFISRGLNEIEHIVILGYSGMITFEAIKWIIDQKIMVTLLDFDGQIVTDFMPESHISGITKRRQATADNSFNMKISSWLLSKKFRGQRETLSFLLNYSLKASWWNKEREYRIEQANSISLNREQALINCINADSQRVLEAQAAAAYWHCFEGIPLLWDKKKNIPINWLEIGNRTSPKSSSPRKAIDPFNACLNYLYAVLETKVRNTCVVNGVDPDFGIIHADHTSRTSLVFDLMEPIRPKVDRFLLEWFFFRTFKTKDFFETREGICRVSPDITSQIIPFIKGLTPDVVQVVKEFAGFFKNRMVLQKPEEFKKAVGQKVSSNPKARMKRPKQEKLKFEEEHSQRTTYKINLTKEPEINQSIKSKQFIIKGKRNCLECGHAFTPNNNRQKFCCGKHKDVYTKRAIREKRAAEGRCPQCGGPMPEAANGTYKEKLTYCPKCAEYWKKRYERKKADSC